MTVGAARGTSAGSLETARAPRGRNSVQVPEGKKRQPQAPRPAGPFLGITGAGEAILRGRDGDGMASRPDPQDRLREVLRSEGRRCQDLGVQGGNKEEGEDQKDGDGK